MATLSASGGAGQVTFTGTGYQAGERVAITVAFSATGRRFNEMRAAIADGSGAISAVVPVPFAGSVSGRAQNFWTWLLAATSGTATVT